MNTAALRIHHAALRLFAENGGTTVAVSELAREAGLSRGTIYNNLADPNGLFTSVCQTVAEEFGDSIGQATRRMQDPAERISAAIRLCVRRVHEDPHWGRFIARYAMLEPTLGSFWGKMPAEELRRGLISGRFDFHRDQIASITASAGGATFGAMTLVLDGYRTWRQAGTDTAEIILRGIGIDRAEARDITQQELDPLPRMTVFDAA
ncbi:possible transcriptional regulator, TetR family protein [Pseudooceanicola batsensis HTCC2597]|uniref:Possible transcriptional regulator, TetR family protein n=1 Tax=Pseudooceanicola batsensis (strain ATCC BAA-863 / DSM 15984 / KCTC 12145 / HTCC2597) TaxID=252305 RepID=A3TZ77_PSEBH|nr:TetR/AcrR family transcriptional regulator [Pseudooceanicola batsensis]EAQ02895.1 possible transcriptional regulator, TetR family protein [Pseudooceanicola batsensis HTCC2597]